MLVLKKTFVLFCFYFWFIFSNLTAIFLLSFHLAGADAGFVKRGGRVSKFVKRGDRMADIARKRAEFALLEHSERRLLLLFFDSK